MTFIFKMAWRDSRASRRRLVLFSFSIVLGIAALVAIGSFRENLRQAIEDQSKSLLGADFVVNSRQKLAPEVESQLKAVGGEQSHEVVLSSMLVVPDGRTRLVQIRALEGDFPFYGDFQTAPANAAGSLKAGHSAILEESLLLQFGLKPGDKIKLGRAEFMVLAALQKIPGESAALASISPRVFIPLSDLAATQLVKEGSFARYRYYFKLPADRDVSALVVDLKNKLSALRLNYETVTDRKRELGDAMKNATSFMSLVGFLSLFLGAIGVGSAINVYVKQKLATVATLRCLGASARTGFAIYLVQGLALGVVGAVVGTVVGILIQLSLPYIVGNFLPFSVDFFVSWRAVGRGSAAGLFVSLVFTLLPLMAVRNVSPLRALRSASGEEKKAWRDPWRFGIYLLIAVTVTVFSVMQAERKIQGLAFAAGLGVAFAVLTGVAWLLSRAARKFTPAGLPYVWRQGLANLYRPNNRTVLLLVSLGLGTFLMLTLALTRETLLQQIRGVAGNDRSNLMFFDIQDDQIEPLTQLLTKAGVPIKASAPIVTMRITSLKGKTVDELLQEDKAVKAEKPLQEGANRGRNRGQAQRPPGWTLRREYRSTFRDNLTETEKLVSGKFIPRVAPGVAKVPISVEEGLAR
ncbi:MAG TPA: ABC transporter permease, partial [Opitutaceae bacterium]|nr:ABC transporter permease [Opitutaceae bacterium]